MIGTTHMVGITVTIPFILGTAMMYVASRRGFVDKEPLWVFMTSTEGVLALLLGVQAHSDALQTGQTGTATQLAATLLAALIAGTLVLAAVVFVEYNRRNAALEALEAGRDGN